MNDELIKVIESIGQVYIHIFNYVICYIFCYWFGLGIGNFRLSSNRSNDDGPVQVILVHFVSRPWHPELPAIIFRVNHSKTNGYAKPNTKNNSQNNDP